ncbi:MAG TPA: ATP-binding protein [Solirubrobacterales bacterium]|jgi:K+-sensing histidine kinase KdpD|nr:ATP-binding protein [Solirubrobacterales bacterium]
MSQLAVGLLVSIGCVALCTAAIYPLREITPAVSTGVVYMLGVLIVSTYYGLWPGLFTSVASAAAFNFFHIPPTGTLDIAKSENWVALVVFFIVAAIASSLAEQSRARAREAERRRREANLAVQAAFALLADRERLQAATIETEALRRSDEVKTALLRAVSHDLRSPLTAILAAGEALTSPGIEQNDRRALAKAVTDEASRLSGLVDKLLDLSRLEAGQAQPRPDWCSIEEVVAAAVEDLGGRGELIRVSIDNDLPFVRADAAQLERAIANLLENAVRFSGGEQSLVRGRALGDRVVIRVVDRGPGIPPADLDHVFEPFYQRPDDRPHEGSGLGLAIVRGLVEVNGGRVWAESVPGQGTTFVIELPFEPRAEQSHPVPQEVG